MKSLVLAEWWFHFSLCVLILFILLFSLGYINLRTALTIFVSKPVSKPVETGKVWYAGYGREPVVGPSGVRALPLAAGINEGGHYFRYFCHSPTQPQPQPQLELE